MYTDTQTNICCCYPLVRAHPITYQYYTINKGEWGGLQLSLYRVICRLNNVSSKQFTQRESVMLQFLSMAFKKSRQFNCLDKFVKTLVILIFALCDSCYS